jgi:sugar phosphate isomerase/epimerase
MKIGLTSFALRWAFQAGMPIADFLHLAADAGAEVVQLCENSGVDRLDEAGLEELAQLAARLDLVLEGGGRGADLAQMQAGIRRTASLDGIIYRCVIDSDGLAPEMVIANLRALLPLLRDSGVVLCVENHSRFAPQTVRRIVTAVDDPAVGVCLDPLNSIAQWVGPEETIRELAPLARTAHIKDARIERSGAGFAITGVALGEGQLDLAGYLAAVAPRVESLLFESWMNPVDGESGKSTLAQESLWARSALALLRQLCRGNLQQNEVAAADAGRTTSTQYRSQ